MTIIGPVSFTPLPFFSPLSNITPFTYRDGATYLAVLESLRARVVELQDASAVLTENDNSIIDSFNTALDELAASLNAALFGLGDPVAIAAINAQLASLAGQISTFNNSLTNIVDDVSDLTTSVNVTLPASITALRNDIYAHVALVPEQFGAMGDGLTNDTVAMNESLSAAALQKKPLMLRGTYVVHNTDLVTLTIPSGVSVIGSGTLTFGVAAPKGIALSAGASIDGVVIDTRGLVTSYTVDIQNADDVTVSNVSIVGAGAGALEIRGTSKNCRVLNTIVDSHNNPVRIRNTASATIRSCHFTNWKIRGIYVLGTVDGAPRNIVIDSNVIGVHASGGGTRGPMHFESVDSQLITAVSITNNVVTSNDRSFNDLAEPGCADAISLHRVSNFIVSGNQVTDVGDTGITVSQQSQHGAVFGNILTRVDSCGICVGSEDSDYADTVSVVGNVIIDPFRDRLADGVERASCGVLVNRGRNVFIDGNIMNDTQAPHKVKYGHSLVNATGVRVGMNRWANTTIGPRYVSGVNTNCVEVTTQAI